MKLFVPTTADPRRLTDPKPLRLICDLCQFFQTQFVCHTRQQAELLQEKMRDEGMLDFEHPDIIVSGVPMGHAGLVTTRDFIERQLCLPGEWYVSMDDNIDRVLMTDEHDHPDRDDHYEANAAQLAQRIDELRAECVRVGTNYGGFGYMENPFYRSKRWKYGSYVKGKLFVKSVDDQLWRWLPEISIMQDTAKALDTMARYGLTCVDDHVVPLHPRYSPGGVGTYEERLPHRLRTMEAVTKYLSWMCELKEGEFGNLDSYKLKYRVPGRRFDEARERNVDPG